MIYRTRNQEPGTKMQGPGTKIQEPRTKTENTVDEYSAN